LAAVLGRQFDVHTLTAASEWQEGAVIDALETAERAQLIAEVPAEKGSAFSFVHGLIPTTLVEGLRTLQLRGLHARAAAAIEEQRPDDFEALAYHYVQAGLAPKAITYLLRAGDRARSLYAHQEAIDHYLQALDFSEGAEPQLRARTWMRLGLTYHNAFQFSAARQAYEKGFALWQQVAETQRQPDAAPAPHALRLSWSNPLTLDPSMAADGASAAVIEELFDGLVNRSPEMEVIPAVARSWEVLEGGTRYVFHLRGDVLWSDGVQLTAGDFEYAWRRVLDPAIGSPHASFLYDVAESRAFREGQASWDDVGVRAADERTLVVDLEDPRGHFLQLLAHVATYPLPRHKVEALGGAWAALGNVVNNGPFVLQEWKSGESMTFDRNPRYYGRREGNVQRVQISLQPEPESVLQLYEQDQLDIVGLSPRVINRARHLHAGEYVSLPSPSTYYLAFDVTHPPFDNVPVRRAFSLATDKEGLADVAHRGFSFPATGGLVPPGVPGHSPDSGSRSSATAPRRGRLFRRSRLSNGDHGGVGRSPGGCPVPASSMEGSPGCGGGTGDSKGRERSCTRCAISKHNLRWMACGLSRPREFPPRGLTVAAHRMAERGVRGAVGGCPAHDGPERADESLPEGGQASDCRSADHSPGLRELAPANQALGPPVSHVVHQTVVWKDVIIELH